MSDKPISVGDWVMVVRGMPCCGTPTGAEGMVFRVSLVITEAPNERCGRCYAPIGHIPAAGGCPGRKPIDTPRLRRFDQDALKDDVPTKEELHA